MPTVTPTHKTIQDLLKDEKFSIDDYQREYKWETKQIVELLNDLQAKFSSCYQSGHETCAVGSYESYFLGSIIVSKRAGTNYLIDGQQRTTSLTLLLIYLYHRLQAVQSPATSSLESLIYSDDFGTMSFNLKIPERVPVLEALFKKEEFNTDNQDESLVNMVERYTDIEAEFTEELDEAIEHFVYWLTRKVGLIEIATDDDAYAYTIFETMNDRGKPLSPTDMLKAYLLGRIDDAEKRSSANARWKAEIQNLMHFGRGKDDDIESNFLKTWLRAQYGTSTRDRKAHATEKDWEQIGGAFHRWVDANRQSLGLDRSAAYEELIRNHLPFYAKIYRQILEASHSYTPGLEAIFYNGTNDFTLQTTVLMAPITVNDDEETVRRKLQIVATYLDQFIVRRVVNYIRVTYSSVQYGMVQLINEIRHKSPEELIEILTARLEREDATFEGAKGGQRKGVANFGLNNFTKRYVHYMLARMSAHVEKASDLGDRFPAYANRHSDSMKNPFEVEHLWEDHFDRFSAEFTSEDEFARWRNHLGGLILLPKSKNASVNDKPYVDKVSFYTDENLLASSLTPQPYAHSPRFKRFREETGLAFEACPEMGKSEQLARRSVYKQLIETIWCAERLRKL